MKNKHARVMVLVQDTSFECAFEIYAVSLSSSKSYRVIVKERNSIANDQREITPRISIAELWFMCMTGRLNVLYEFMKFR